MPLQKRGPFKQRGPFDEGVISRMRRKRAFEICLMSGIDNLKRYVKRLPRRSSDAAAKGSTVSARSRPRVTSAPLQPSGVRGR